MSPHRWVRCRPSEIQMIAEAHLAPECFCQSVTGWHQKPDSISVDQQTGGHTSDQVLMLYLGHKLASKNTTGSQLGVTLQCSLGCESSQVGQVQAFRNSNDRRNSSCARVPLSVSHRLAPKTGQYLSGSTNWGPHFSSCLYLRPHKPLRHSSCTLVTSWHRKT